MTDMPQDTLEKLSAARHYNQWVYRLCRPFLGSRLLEVGCGIGNMTEWFLPAGSLLATDLNCERVQALAERWRGRPRFAVAAWDITQPAPEAVRAFEPDTILCINLLEHIAAEEAALANLESLLPPGGRMVVYVPALPFLFGTLDQELGHLRRYTRRSVRALLARSRMELERLHYVNAPGIPGWWLNGFVLRRRHFSHRQILLYDSLIPWIEAWEERLRPCLGQSLFCVARKRC